MRVFDTNILIDYFNGHAAARRLILDEATTGAISVVTWSELLVGCATQSQQRGTKDFIRRYLQIIPTGEDIGEIAADIRRERKLKLPDALILATAVHKGGELFTRDKKDFGGYARFVKLPYIHH